MRKRKPITVSQDGVFVVVQYPHRKTPDLYVALREHPVFCAQCGRTFPVEQFSEHVLGHDTRNREHVSAEKELQ